MIGSGVECVQCLQRLQPLALQPRREIDQINETARAYAAADPLLEHLESVLDGHRQGDGGVRRLGAGLDGSGR